MRHFGLFVMASAVVAAWTSAVVAAGPAAASAAPAHPASAVPAVSRATAYSDPAFGDRCYWHVFGEGERPPWWLFLEDPLCVEYSKRDITLDNGGWLVFLLAEPSRFGIAIPSCRYWQRDHWSVQVTAGAVPVVTWDGNYWFDKGRGDAAARLSNFRIGGLSVGVGDAVAALRPDFPELAAALSTYGDTTGGSGLRTATPRVFGC